MSANKSQDPMDPGQSNEQQQGSALQGSGAGAASALERMKEQTALRHRHKHGARTAGPGHEEDQSPER